VSTAKFFSLRHLLLQRGNHVQQKEARISMFTSVMKCISIVVLVLGFFWNLPVGSSNWSVTNGGYMELFNLVVCLSALLFVVQGFRQRKYFWAAGFVAIAALFNPVVPVTLSRKMFLGLDSVCMVTFLVSLALSKRRPVLTVPSITNGRPQIESL